jgi:DnaJ-class molecular chaperone
MPARNHYLVLGVSEEETPAEIRKAFRKLVKRYHPDLVGPGWINRYNEVVAAYEVLSDPERRIDYNRSLPRTAPPTRQPTINSPFSEPEPLFSRPVSLTRDFGNTNVPWDELLDGLFRNPGQRSTPWFEQTRGLNLEIILSPKEALNGGSLLLKVPAVHYCPHCGGSGEVWLFRCPHCFGQGWMESEETVSLTIPPRVGHGTMLEMPLRGSGVPNLQLRVLIGIG